MDCFFCEHERVCKYLQQLRIITEAMNSGMVFLNVEDPNNNPSRRLREALAKECSLYEKGDNHE